MQWIDKTIREAVDGIIDDVGIDAKHSYEDQIMPVEEAYDRYRDRIAIMGGLDLDRLCMGSEDEVRRYSRWLVENLGVRGGYALGSGNSIASYVPMQNYLSMIGEGWMSGRGL